MLGLDNVTDKTFTTTSRLREGYEISEVDAFRAEVAEAINLRNKLISELRDELDAALARTEEATPLRGKPLPTGTWRRARRPLPSCWRWPRSVPTSSPPSQGPRRTPW